MKNPLILISVIISVLLIGGVILFSRKDTTDVKSNSLESPVVIENDIQFINITSTRGGYFPTKVTAKANIETVLRMESKNSYGCERAFRIPALNINQVLPSEGITEFELGIPQKEEKVFGSCSMGMYTFTITFE